MGGFGLYETCSKVSGRKGKILFSEVEDGGGVCGEQEEY